VLDRPTVDRLRRFDTSGVPVLSVYLDVGTDLTSVRSLPIRLKAALDPIRDQVAAGWFGADAASVDADLDEAARLLEDAPEARGGSLALFLCSSAGLSEAVALPGPVRDRAIADRSPYLGPMEAMLAHYRRYCAVVADRRNASIYRFWQGQMEAWEMLGEEEVRKDNFGGFEGREEQAVRARAEAVARRLFKATAERIAELLRAGEFDLLMIGGNPVNVRGIEAELSAESRAVLAGTFTLDPGTASPADVVNRCTEVAAAYEREAAAAEVQDLLDAVGAGDRAILGLDAVLEAVNQRAVARLVVAATGIESGVGCPECGWLARRGALCGYCGEAVVMVPDLVDSVAERTRADGGEVLYPIGHTGLGDAQVGARLRFEVATGA
jgi:peptide subunit release factor 1 (eRF1)